MPACQGYSFTSAFCPGNMNKCLNNKLESLKVTKSNDNACFGVVEVEKYSMCDDLCVMVWSKLRNIACVMMKV